VKLGPTIPQTRETPAQRPPHHPNPGTPAVPVVTGDPSRKRKRPPEPPNPKAELDPPSRPPTDNQASERSSQTSQSSKRLKLDCVLITTLPPVSARKTTPLETSENAGHSTRARAVVRGREKQRGKQREDASTSGTSAHSDSRSLAGRSTRSSSHSVSSLRRPLFEPVSLELLRIRSLLTLVLGNEPSPGSNRLRRNRGRRAHRKGRARRNKRFRFRTALSFPFPPAEEDRKQVANFSRGSDTLAAS